MRLDCQRQHRATGKTGHFLLLNQKQWGWGQKLGKGGRDQFVKETSLELGEDKGIILKQRPIEGLPLVSTVLSVKPVLLHTWATRVLYGPAHIQPSLSHSDPVMVLPVHHVLFLATDLFPHLQATRQSPQTDTLRNTATHSTM